MLTTIHRVYEPPGRCIYCDESQTPLSNEHIIAHGLGGRYIFRDASCGVCADKTKRIENIILTNMLGDMRQYIGIRSRKRGIPQAVQISIGAVGNEKNEKISLKDFPAILKIFSFAPPEILLGIPPSGEGLAGQLAVKALRPDINEVIRKLGGRVSMKGNFSASDFARMLAKIGHAFAMAERGVTSFKPFLKNLILGEPPMFPGYYVGGGFGIEPKGVHLHEINLRDEAVIPKAA